MGDASKPPTQAPRPPPKPDGTLLFKLTNPELMLDPKKRGSWAITGGVAAFFACYVGWTYYWEQRELRDAPQPPPPKPIDEEVAKVLPGGRVLMKDGSIRQQPPS